jgi:hypothetical protein
MSVYQQKIFKYYLRDIDLSVNKLHCVETVNIKWLTMFFLKREDFSQSKETSSSFKNHL